MSQLSVPSSDVFSEIVFSADLNAVGAASFWEALAEDDEGSYVRSEWLEELVQGYLAQAVFNCGMQTVNDPGVNTGYTLRIIARWNGVETPFDWSTPASNPDQMEFYIALGPGADLFSNPATLIVQIGPQWGGQNLIDAGEIPSPSASFIEIIRPLTEAEVIDFRTNGGFDQFWVLIWQDVFSGGATGPFNPGNTFDVAFIQLEVPDAGPTPDIEITGDGGFIFGGSNYFEVLSDAGLIFDFSSPINFNHFLSDAGLIFGGGGLAFGNAIVSDAGLIFGGGGLIVLSADSSGIYTFVIGQHFDRILNRNTADNETVDVEIPSPFGKTGYFGG